MSKTEKDNRIKIRPASIRTANLKKNNQFIWHQNYSVQIYEIDKQHKEIITLVRDMSKLCVIDDDESFETFQMMLFNAGKYIKYHFLEEEKFMQKNNYPAYLEHKEKHRNMLLELYKMLCMIRVDSNITIKSVTDYLSVWFSEHFISSDKAMGDYFNTAGKNITKVFA